MSLLDIAKTERLEFINLPLDVLHLIFVQAVLARGVKRALRLRLVCKTFANLVLPALFETHLMDSHFYPRSVGSYDWQLDVGSKYGADKLWHKYLVYRVMDERDQTVGRFVQMRQLAQEICQEMERERGSALNLHAIIEGLCWLTLTKGNSPHDYDWDNNTELREKSELRKSLGLNLLSAAAYFDLLPFAKRLVAEGHSPTSYTQLFASPIQVAAQAGNIAMLQFFQEQLLEPSCFEPYSVIGASIRGDIDILRLAFRLPTRTEENEGDGESEHMNNQQFGSIKHETETGRSILKARRYTSSIEVYEYLTSALAPFPPELLHNTYMDLQHHAQLGNMTMVRYLLDLGVPVQKVDGSRESPLIMACRGWREDIVDLLLERGADPNFVPERLWPSFPLHESETAGNLSIARKLLERGADTYRDGAGPGLRLPVLSWAFVRERADMIQLLREHGAILNSRFGEHLATMLSCLGYDSMAQLLQQEYGYEVVGQPIWPSRGMGWHKQWREARALAPRREKG